ncbi:MAG: GNAT family N-acetyltransferase [Desulfobacter sp.]|nr:GNAT family N-acetyltransferase [Desulfobacter sp.]
MKIRPANEQNLLELSGWFLTESEAKNWGGPSIHFPLSLEQLKIDIEWNVALSYALVDKGDDLLGFAQSFNKFGCKHLGRIVVSPKMRGKKLGYKLMEALLDSAGTKGVNFSLFVYKENIPAKKLYQSIGFEVRANPEGQPEIKDCMFMVKKA